MGKRIKIIKIISLSLIVFQLLVLLAFCIIYFNNFFDIQTNFDVRYVAMSAAIFVAVDCVFVWSIVMAISSLRKKTDLKAADIIGNDIQEAYNFAMVGLVVTDDDGIVIWYNELLRDRHVDIIDMNIYDWNKDLLQFKQGNANPDLVVKVEINSRNYDVKCLPEANLWIFKDTTDYENTYSYSREQAPVVGILAIDNYDDVVRGEDDFNDIVTKVKNVIFTYCKEYGILLRRIKDDNYSMICNYLSYSKMKANHFSLVDKVREVSSGQDIPLTLSIGIAHNFPDVIKLNDMAADALDIAMSRGGDQIVVNAFGNEMEFYGGRSEAQEKRNRVKVRVLADSLVSLLKSGSNILVMGHANMDMDAFGACLGVKAICERLGKPCQIVADLKNTELKTRGAMTSSFTKEQLDEFIVSSKDAPLSIKPETLLVVVDVHTTSMTMAPSLVEKCAKVVVIDHHRRGEDYIENPVFNHVDPAASSTCELVAEFIRFSSINPRITIPSAYATIMLSGIFLDSSFFKSRNTGMRTFEASSILKEFGADNAIADDLLKDNYEEYRSITEIISNLEHPCYGVVVGVADLEKTVDPVTISKAANLCLDFKGIKASFIIGKVGPKDVKVSARSDGTINVQLLLEKIGGGGHFSMAAATLNGTTVEEVRKMVLETISNHLNEASRHGIMEEDE